MKNFGEIISSRTILIVVILNLSNCETNFNFLLKAIDISQKKISKFERAVICAMKCTAMCCQTRTEGKINGLSTARPIILHYIGGDFILLDPAIPKIFYFKHDVGASLFIIFIAKSYVGNIGNAIPVTY